MVIAVVPELKDRRMGGQSAAQGLEVGGGDEDEGEGVVVGPLARTDHPEVELEGERVVGVDGGEGADHDVEGVVVGAGVPGEEEQGVGEVVEEEELGEQVVGLVDAEGEHVGVYLLEAAEGGTSLEER